MNPTTAIAGVERLGHLAPAQQDFLIQLGLIVVAIVALAVAYKALARRAR